VATNTLPPADREAVRRAYRAGTVERIIAKRGLDRAAVGALIAIWEAA